MAAITIPVGLTHYYKMDDVDLDENTINPGTDDLTPTGAGTRTLVTGRLGNAINLVGPNSIMAAPSNGNVWMPPPTVPGEAAFTVALWVNFNEFSAQPFSEPDQTIIMESTNGADSGTTFEMGVTTTTQIPYFQVTQSDLTTIRVSSTFALVVGTWYFIAGWVDGSKQEIGILNQTSIVTAAYDGTVNPVSFPSRFIGRRTNTATGNIQGIIDDVDIWSDRRLSIDELREIENDDAGREDILNIPNPAVPTVAPVVGIPASAQATPLPTIFDALTLLIDDILSRLGDDGTLFSREEILHWLSEATRRFGNQARHARLFTALDMPPRYTRAITFEWESQPWSDSDDGGTYRKFTFTHQNGLYECTYLWEAQLEDNLPGTAFGRSVTQLWELAYGEGSTDQPYRFALPKGEGVIHGVWHDHDRIEATTSRQLNNLEDQWWQISGEPQFYAQTLGDANTFDLYQIQTSDTQSYEHLGTKYGIPRAIGGGTSTRTYEIASGQNSWGYSYTWNGEAEAPAAQLDGPGYRWTDGPVTDPAGRGDFYYTYGWERELMLDPTLTTFTDHTAIVATNPDRDDAATEATVFTRIDLPLGIVRRILSPDRQYWPSPQWLPYGSARRWNSSDQNILVYHSVQEDDFLSEDDVLAIFPLQSIKYLAFYALSLLLNRPGEGYDPALAGHYEERASRGVVLLKKLSQTTRIDTSYIRGGKGTLPRVNNQLPQLPSNFPRAPWLRRR